MSEANTVYDEELNTQASRTAKQVSEINKTSDQLAIEAEEQRMAEEANLTVDDGFGNRIKFGEPGYDEALAALEDSSCRKPLGLERDEYGRQTLGGRVVDSDTLLVEMGRELNLLRQEVASLRAGQ